MVYISLWDCLERYFGVCLLGLLALFIEVSDLEGVEVYRFSFSFTSTLNTLFNNVFKLHGAELNKSLEDKTISLLDKTCVIVYDPLPTRSQQRIEKGKSINFFKLHGAELNKSLEDKTISLLNKTCVIVYDPLPTGSRQRMEKGTLKA
jgi:hypothetical protein